METARAEGVGGLREAGMEGSGGSEGQGARVSCPFEYIHQQQSCANNFLVKVICGHESHCTMI